MRTFSLGPLLLLLSLSGASAAAADTWHVAWTRQLPERQPMWAHNSRRYPMDGVATVVDAGDLLLVGCTADGTVRAYRRADGGEAWRFAFDGAVRWTPTVAGDAVFVGSDDGTVACLNLKDGGLRWRYRPGPGTRQCIGHQRLQSSWPIATSIAVGGGMAYGGCGYFTDDGIWVFAVDAATGEERLLRRQFKDRVGGRVVVEGDSLAFARLGGRCDEAENLEIVFDIASGERRYATDAKGKVVPASLRAPKPDRPPLLRLVRGADNTYTFSEATQSHDVAKAIDAGAATATKLPATGQQTAPLEDPTGGPGRVTQCLPSADAAQEVMVVATSGHRLIGFSRNRPASPAVLAEPEAEKSTTAHPLAAAIDGGWVLVAGLADGGLVESLARGGGAAHLVAVDADPARTAIVRKRLMDAGLMSSGRVQVLTIDHGSDDLPSWCFAFVATEREGVSSGLTRLLRPYGGTLLLPAKVDPAAVIDGRGDLEVVALGAAKAVRRPGLATGHGNWSHDMADAANASGLVEADLKFPLGVHWYGGPADSGDNFMVPTKGTQEGQVPQPQAHLLAKGVWIQQGIGRVVAYDQYTGRFLWKQELPAWFPLSGLGIHSAEHKEPWDDPASNLMPVTSRDMCRSGGFNMSCNTNELFIAAAKELRVYDLLTGMQRAAWKIPAELGDLRWGHLRVNDQVVVASVFSGDDLRRARAGWDGNGGYYAKDRQLMRHLVCLDARTGDMRWKVDAARGFVNHGFAMGGGRVYAVDLLGGGVVKGIATTDGSVPPNADKGSIRAIDLATGRQLWEFDLPVQLTDIVYDAAHDTLILPSRHGFKLVGDTWKGSPDKSGKDRGNGVLLGLRGADGSELYRRSEFTYNEPYSLVGKRIVQKTGMEVDALTGQRFERRSPVTGVTAFWNVPTAGCTHLISSRSFSANRSNWIDQDNCMVGTLSGDSGCSPTNIPAGGLVNISNAAMPRFSNRAQSTTRTLAYREPVTAWAGDQCLKLEAAPAPVQVLGLLPDAPGNRADAQGRWWIRVQSTGFMAGQAPRLSKGEAAPAALGQYEIAEHRFRGAQGLPAWVGAWGQIGPAPLHVPVVFPVGKAALDGSRYRLRFVVAEPETKVKVGQRVFSISCDDTVVADQVDPLALAKAPRTGAVVQAEVTPKGPVIKVTLTAKDGSLPPVIGGILIERLP
jgi:outer membrane protein assembly factor BamB